MFKNDTIESLIFSAELDDNNASVLDLHGYTVDQAEHEIENFLSREHAGVSRKDYKVVKIITGSGSGKLQESLKKILSKKSLSFVEYYRFQMQPMPSNAVMFVVLAPNSAS
ncbi:MAG: Smr/MutS family protein [Patescibacteria group bacterium]|nr:Smr/MutS family protein [Patescibacteria group bacterium]